MELKEVNWTAEFQGAVTVCDLHGIVVEMNARSAEMYKRDGGRELIGRNLFDCHPEPSRSKLRELLESGESNVYTIERNGIKKLIYQVPWIQNGEKMGMVELVLEIPMKPPHFVRS